jgi:endonuclease G
MKRLRITLGMALAGLLLFGSVHIGSVNALPYPALAQPQATSIHIALGNPSNATSSTSNTANYLMVKDQYALSYNRGERIPNWVSWHVDAADLGDEPRGQFAPDTSLPSGWYRVKPTDYHFQTYGYDRGHMCPSGDRTANRRDNNATFLMTNMVPQHPHNNQGPWAKFEIYCRDLVEEGNELYIVAGPHGSKGEIRESRINIPEITWKVVVVLEDEENDLQRINEDTRVIAIIMPNSEGIKRHGWRRYRVTVDEIEKRTGYNLLSALPEDLQRRLQSRRDDD